MENAKGFHIYIYIIQCKVYNTFATNTTQSLDYLFQVYSDEKKFSINKNNKICTKAIHLFDH